LSFPKIDAPRGGMCSLSGGMCSLSGGLEFVVVISLSKLLS
jgi:hypothetical protein